VLERERVHRRMRKWGLLSGACRGTILDEYTDSINHLRHHSAGIESRFANQPYESVVLTTEPIMFGGWRDEGVHNIIQ